MLLILLHPLPPPANRPSWELAEIFPPLSYVITPSLPLALFNFFTFESGCSKGRECRDVFTPNFTCNFSCWGSKKCNHPQKCPLSIDSYHPRSHRRSTYHTDIHNHDRYHNSDDDDTTTTTAVTREPGEAVRLADLMEKMEVLRESVSFWKYEDLSRQNLYLPSVPILSEYVEYVVGALPWIDDLAQRWGREALETALATENPHIFSRSLQLYRALKPKISKGDLKLLVERLQVYVKKGQGVCVGLEIVLSLRDAVGWLDSEDVVQMPQFFWVAVALLLSNDPLEYFAGGTLLSTVLANIEFTSSSVQQFILSGFPYNGWNPPFMGFLPLVLKGLTNRQTEQMALNVLSETALLPHGPVIDIDPKRRLLLNTLALLPHLCLYMGKEGAVEMAKGLSCMFDYSASGYLDNSSELAEVFLRYSAGEFANAERFVEEVAAEVAISFFPSYELLLFSFFVELLDCGNPQYEGVLLLLLDCFLSFVKVEGSLLQTKGMAFFAPIEQRVKSSQLCLDSLSIIKKIVLNPSLHPAGGASNFN